MSVLAILPVVVQRVLLLVIAGALGTLARMGVYAGIARTGISLPLGTLSVNVAGSFLFGLVWPLAEGAGGNAGRLSVETRTIILGGFMGAFTTFSTFAFETGQYLRQGDYLGAGLNVLANNVLGIGAFLVGVWLTGNR